MADVDKENDPNPPPEQPSTEYIKIKLVNQESNEVHFRVRKKIQLAKIKKTYADRSGVGVSSLRFLFDGRRVNDEDTPISLNMIEDDIIEVYQEQLGGFRIK